MNRQNEVLIVGAGLSGLCCARVLHKANIPFRIFEKSESVGGRVKTDLVEGYLLDRGFQIFLTAYPEAKAVLNYAALDLRPFIPGALVRRRGEFHEVSDPLRRPAKAIETLLSPVGTVADKAKVGLISQLGAKISRGSSGAVTTIEGLEQFGFSDAMIAEFFRPFLGGIFLERELTTSATMFDFVFEMLGSGDNILPSRGMQSIPQQLADALPDGSIKFKQEVIQVEGNSIKLASGEMVAGACVVVATEEPFASKLLGLEPPQSFNSQTCVYFGADKSPIDEPILVLNGDSDGIVNNFCVPSLVAPSYAPEGKALMSASIVGIPDMTDTELTNAVLAQMRNWFGNEVDEWEHLRTYRVKYALPAQTPDDLSSRRHTVSAKPSVYCCGDYKETGSINGAMLSGRKTAEAVIQDLAARSAAKSNVH